MTARGGGCQCGVVCCSTRYFHVYGIIICCRRRRRRDAKLLGWRALSRFVDGGARICHHTWKFLSNAGNQRHGIAPSRFVNSIKTTNLWKSGARLAVRVHYHEQWLQNTQSPAIMSVTKLSATRQKKNRIKLVAVSPGKYTELVHAT